jgi:hypothetical protein
MELGSYKVWVVVKQLNRLVTRRGDGREAYRAWLVPPLPLAKATGQLGFFCRGEETRWMVVGFSLASDADELLAGPRGKEGREHTL